jgi:hypothetical protein
VGDEVARQRSRACLGVSWAQPTLILRLLTKEANPASFATAPSSGYRCRTAALLASAPDASLSVAAPDIEAGSSLI